MKNIIKQHSPKKHAKSFKYAIDGIIHAMVNEPNFRVHIIATGVVFALGEYFRISAIEWAIITLITAMVLTSELVNTFVEVLMDHMFKEYHEVAKVVKDVAAGYVLVNAVAAIIIFLLIFGPRLTSLNLGF